MENLAKKILKDRADDTKVLITIATILKLLVFQHTCTDEGSDKELSRQFGNIKLFFIRSEEGYAKPYTLSIFMNG